MELAGVWESVEVLFETRNTNSIVGDCWMCLASCVMDWQIVGMNEQRDGKSLEFLLQ